MEPEEVIEQLESLKNNSASFAVTEEPNSIWHRDIAALNIAINKFKKDLQGLQSQKGQ